MSTLSHFRLCQILCFQVGIPLEHLERFVPPNGGHLHGIQALFKEAAGDFVPEIVEGEIGQEGLIVIYTLLLACFL